MAVENVFLDHILPSPVSFQNVCYKHSLIVLGTTYQPPCSLEGEGESIVAPSGKGPHY